MFDYVVHGFVTLVQGNGDKFNIAVNFRPSDLNGIEEVIAKVASDVEIDNYSVESIEF